VDGVVDVGKLGMLAFFFEPRRRVLIARFGEALGAEDLGALQALAQRFVQAEGRVPLIIDFSATTRIDVPTEALVRLARARPVMGEATRICVAPVAELYGLGRLFITHQAIAGFTTPLLVRTLDEAYDRLDLVDPRFEPWPS